MKQLFLTLLLASFGAHAEPFCQFMPKNDMRIPVGAEFANSAMTEQTFNKILNRVEATYQNIVTKNGGQLAIQRLWSEEEVNAYADREGSVWKIYMFGGMARHPQITEDGFSLIACHELGHHLGGTPHYDGVWATNEGQSDYWATLKCARRIWAEDNNGSIMSRINVPTSVKRNCTTNHVNSEAAAICMRSAMAGYALGKVLASMGMTDPNFETPDQNKVPSTEHGHPEAQCRLDTYYAGAVCKANLNQDVNSSNPEVGTCNESQGFTIGTRPRCWYNPDSKSLEPSNEDTLLLVGGFN
jgi:hypothetical protein